MKTEFSGIEEKLKRADENIVNLQSEITGFFEKSKYPVFPKINSKEHDEAVKYFSKLPVPIRFGVLAGEIVHHLRSCLDHVIWQLSDDVTRNSKEGRFLEFPILDTRPTAENKFSRYGRKIQGVKHVSVLKLIEELQPYNRTHPHADMLWFIHEMDVFDKHRELVIMHPTGYMIGPLPLMREVSAHFTRKVRMSAELKRQFDEYGQITPEVSFRDLPGWEAQPIVKVLTQLTDYVRYIVRDCEKVIGSQHL
jgi:hypothetical protein